MAVAGGPAAVAEPSAQLAQDLQAVASAWPRLPAHIRDAILTLVNAAPVEG